MESKRQSQQEGDEIGLQNLAHPSKRRREDSQQSKTFIIGNLRSLFHLTSDDIVPPVKDLVQRLVREELKRQLRSGGGRDLQLCFMNKLPPINYTLSEITAEGGLPLQIELRDAKSQQRIVREECYPMKIRICVLNGDFGSNKNEDWTAEEFNSQTLSPREGKGPLLNGDTVITLKNGVGYITEKIVFTDNSSWTRSKSFRLGVKIVQSNNSIEADIREGRSEPFKVKDIRGQATEKHYPPSLNDEIWRLTKIRKDGEIHKRLWLHGIHTVDDLLQLHQTNPSSLQEKFGKIKTKLREAIIKHARTCVADRSKNALNSDTLVDGYRNVQDLMTPVDSLSSLLASLQSAGQRGAQVQLPSAQQDQLEKRQDFSQPCTSTSHIGEAAHNTQVGFEELISLMCTEENIAMSPIVSHVPKQMPDVYSTGNDNFPFPS